MNRNAALGTLGLVAATALVAGSFVPPAVATTPRCFGERATITGSGFIQGTAGRDVVVATGPSEVHSYGGDDLVCGAFLTYAGRGDDRVRYTGDASTGELAGGRGNDVLVWRARGWGELVGNGGHDMLRTLGGGDQALSGGFGRDVLRAGRGDDMLFGGGGADTLHGGLGDDAIDARGGDDSAYGGRGRDDLGGGRGNDHGEGGPGVDTCRGFETGTC